MMQENANLLKRHSFAAKIKKSQNKLKTTTTNKAH